MAMTSSAQLILDQISLRVDGVETQTQQTVSQSCLGGCLEKTKGNIRRKKASKDRINVNDGQVWTVHIACTTQH